MPVTSRPLPRSAPSVVTSMGEETRCSTGVRVAKPRLCESCHVVRPPLPCLTPSPAPILPLRAGRLARAARCAKLLATRARPCFTIFNRTLARRTCAHVGSASVKPRLVPITSLRVLWRHGFWPWRHGCVASSNLAREQNVWCHTRVAPHA